MPAESAAARRAREEREAAEHAAALRRRRLLLLGGAGGLVVLVVAVVLAVGAFKDDPAKKGTRTTVDGVQIRGARETAAMLRGLPQHGTLLGDPDAPATILEVADLKCPGCQAHQLDAQRAIVARLVRTGKANLRLELVNYRDAAAGTTDGEGARRAAYALAATNRFWAFVDGIYWNQGMEQDSWASDALLRRIATANGIDPASVQTRETPASRAGIARAETLARALKTGRTPSIYVLPRGSTQGRSVGATDDVDAIAGAVEAATRGR